MTKAQYFHEQGSSKAKARKPKKAKEAPVQLPYDLMVVMMSLPELHRLVISLHYAGRTIKRISELSGLSERDIQYLLDSVLIELRHNLPD